MQLYKEEKECNDRPNDDDAEEDNSNYESENIR